MRGLSIAISHVAAMFSLGATRSWALDICIVESPIGDPARPSQEPLRVLGMLLGLVHQLRG